MITIFDMPCRISQVWKVKKIFSSGKQFPQTSIMVPGS